MSGCLFILIIQSTFPVLVGTVFGYSDGFYLFPVHARILSFFGTPNDSTLFRYLWEQFFDTRTDSTFSRYMPRFYHFSVLPLIRPFSGIRGGSFWLLARIRSLPGSRPDSTISRYSHRFDHFPVLVGTVFGYSHGFYLFPVHA